MYESFFRLKKKAFALTSDPNFLFLNVRLREALAGMSYAVLDRKGLMVLTGDAGTGKSTLLARLQQYLPARVQASTILIPTLDPAEFLETILLGFGMRDIPASKSQRLLCLRGLLVDNQRQGKISVLIVDEAHKLSPEVLEEVRLMGNIETPEGKLLQILLAGQPELSEILNRENMRQFKQRIAVRLRIEPLVEPEIELYIRCRWREAGGQDSPPITSEAMAAIARFSCGIPRLVNLICDNALLLAFAEESRQVTGAQVRSAAEDLELVPRAPEPAPAPSPVETVVVQAPPPVMPALEPAPFRVLESYARTGSKSRWTRWIRARETA